ncbi:MAG: cytochrome C biogenesis protein [Candidatus Magasanikbacteria bacterium CG11_big_fil_rev_8_21_14_0_20_39_34]|uniref:Cytochrome C biogenesis protein n=1 Tax=Candidatus Magasanikbacteria bacterium CG11_big_fil_rev_8_21_14_0_20_39_34 TaxID=1974653 RepID=A0A2H0N7G8_9BACT|nr:MAG: cytochrome C biogenesis protein [Candidatus Magasanikbacteria bacterium CG11_big_fil_rev_8_21_14_0_20_39_34]
MHFVAYLVSAFLAGVLTFFAPCTFPLLPGYLGFISGASVKEISHDKDLKRKVLKNAFLYVIGFSVVFIMMGTLFGFLGEILDGTRVWLEKIGAIIIIFFGLYLMHIFDLKILYFLSVQKKLSFIKRLTPGRPLSSFLFGVFFALGWTPCVGPVLGSILTLAATSQGAKEGMLLLFVFATGLAVPFLLVAVFVGQAMTLVKEISKILPIISFIGGMLLLIMGILLLTNTIAYWIAWIYDSFSFLHYQRILDYL